MVDRSHQGEAKRAVRVETTEVSLRAQSSMPGTIFGYVLAVSGRHQLGVASLAVAVFLLTAGPLELQRRIVNDALKSGALHEVLLLCGAYAALAVVAGAIKYAFNMYRSWLSERAVRALRRTMHDRAAVYVDRYGDDAAQEGIGISIVLAEAEPVGGFVGMSLSEPLLQCGILTTVFAYMLFLEWRMALFAFLLFAAQMSFVPRLQRHINRYAADRIRVLRSLSGEMIDDWTHGGGSAHEATFLARIDRAFRFNIRIYWVKFGMNYLMNLTYHLGVAGILLVGGWNVVTGRLQVGTVVAFISGLSSLNEPWGDLVNYFRELMVAQVKYRLVAGAFTAPTPVVPGSLRVEGERRHL